MWFGSNARRKAASLCRRLSHN